MRKLNILKTILDLFWIFSLIAAIGIVIFLPFYLFSSDMDIAVKIKGQEIPNQNAFTKIIVFINVVSALIFLYSIYLLRKVVGLFQKREIFKTEVVKLFNLIGKLIVISSIISNVSVFIYNMVERNNVGLSIDFGSYDSFLISVSIGLFFMVISEIFKIAMNIKEESELII
ncbi:DUF2975 domain-containing protein [Flavobacterium aquatile]|uniref:DUF2975 domain-containing protein n=1 Tax=Flavobacterium aquatile LMG 4008 = ATCC 11947 TaxID=1453498 RepID=A0A095SWL3_9FLAO|nr:DUF2975 domain-containing protein [Flavobacterium aquatile]KGD68967.1 hypothetical protein LG45_04825 [Flavobacterium aquatile LMG 4008 = ATCC 11947]OXA65678.1 hypothetical protein B0A61_13580 [Flavobacterium aquatile LMG 4008 = ATCC 11947]GEC79616.1 hypothetical protein FAQ01_24860 [Flavobacterium aquatile]